MENIKLITIVGFKFNDKIGVEELCSEYDDEVLLSKLTFKAEPENQYDPNAIAVYYGDRKIGHVKAAHTSILDGYTDSCTPTKIGAAEVTKTGKLSSLDIYVTHP